LAQKEEKTDDPTRHATLLHGILHPCLIFHRSVGAYKDIEKRDGFSCPKRGKVKMGGLRGGGEERWEKIGIAPPSSNLVRILFY
jgi:hypothetical protein